MRLAGTMIRYSKSAMPQLAAAATYQGLAWKFFRCPYQAKVMKRFEAASMPAVTARVCQAGMESGGARGKSSPEFYQQAGVTPRRNPAKWTCKLSLPATGQQSRAVSPRDWLDQDMVPHL